MEMKKMKVTKKLKIRQKTNTILKSHTYTPHSCFNVILGEAVESDTEFYVKQQQQVQQPPIVQPEDSLRRPPVYFGDRFPVSPNQQHSSSRVAIDDQGDQGQFHLYGLQLGELKIQ